MEVHLNRSAGYRNDLLLMLTREEIERPLLNIAHRDRLRSLPGLVRHRELSREDRQANAACKTTVEEHLKALGLLTADGEPLRPVIAVGNRNLGNNHGFVAWQHDQSPRHFHVRDDPLDYPAYSCLAAGRDGALAIHDLRLAPDGERVYQADSGADVTDHLAWATFGQRVLRAGRVVAIEAIIEQFYDIRHVLAYERNRPEGARIEEEVYRDYPRQFRANALRALLERGVPRNRYLHNAVELSGDRVFILQREGTPEEIAHGLHAAGAEDGVILDNGGSVACWAWWPYPRGGFLFAAPDYRPSATSVIALVLRGPVRIELPGGSVAYTVV